MNFYREAQREAKHNHKKPANPIRTLNKSEYQQPANTARNGIKKKRIMQQR